MRIVFNVKISRSTVCMRALTYFNTLQKPVNIKASVSLIIHIWSNKIYYNY